MSLLKDLQQQVTEDAKAGRKERASFLRFLISQIKNEEIARRGKDPNPNASGRAGEMTDKDVQDILRKEAKRRKEAIDLYKEGGREDLQKQEERELAWIQEYLPPAPTEEEMRETIEQVVAAGGVDDFGAVMGKTMAKLESADGSEVARIVKEVLEGND